MSTQTFTENDHPRGADGKFAPKPSAAEAQVRLGAASSYEEVMGTHDEERYDTYQEAHDAASEVATAGFTGVVHEEAHYDEDTDIDGQRTFTSQDYEVRVFETEEEMADYAERTGVEFSTDRDDIASSVDDYHDPYSSDVETHTLYVERPAPAATQPVGPEDISPGMVIDHHGSHEEVMGVQDRGDKVVLQLDTEDVPVGPGQRVQMVRPAPGL